MITLYSPHVRWARWQAKHALRAFFRRGLSGSFAFGLPLVLFFCEGEASPAWRSADCSAAMSSSRSLLYSGEGDASSASGVVMICLYSAQALGPKHGLLFANAVAVALGAGKETARLVCVQPSVVFLGCSQHNGSANVSAAHG